MKPRRNLALEISLVTLALAGAFVFQMVVSHTKQPKLPEFEEEEAVVTLSNEVPNLLKIEDESEVPALKKPKDYDVSLSDLGEEPDWSVLDNYQHCLSKQECEHLLNDVYSVAGGWRQWFTIEEDHLAISTGENADDKERYQLFFRKHDKEALPVRYWRPRTEQEEVNDIDRPLLGLRIAIDPGHIGGNFAAIEGRRFVKSEGTPPVQEGNLSMTVANLLLEQLEALGATVTLVRERNEPVNPFREEDYFHYAKAKMEYTKALLTPDSRRRTASKLFYRNGEIRARARLVNYAIKPDLVLCIHFNAAPQPPEGEPQLLGKEHFHLILNGAYTADELAHRDERYKLVLKMVQGVHEEEAALATAAADSFMRNAGLPPYSYQANSSRAVNIKGNPYLWGRNLLANRLYDCPVLFYEPYLMNGKDSYGRIQLGDYDGLRYVNGLLRPSIFREYVNAVTEGLVDYYTE